MNYLHADLFYNKFFIFIWFQTEAGGGPQGTCAGRTPGVVRS
jgi:hypothetical protein